MASGTNDPLDELLSLKDELLEAMARGDGDFFGSYVSEEAIALTPIGMLNKEGVIQTVCGVRRFQTTGMDLVQASMVTADVGVIAFRANFTRPDGVDITMLNSIVFHRTPEGWRGVLFQQTPVTPPQPVPRR